MVETQAIEYKSLEDDLKVVGNLVAELNRRLGGTGRIYWKGIETLAETPCFVIKRKRSFFKREGLGVYFPAYADSFTRAGPGAEAAFDVWDPEIMLIVEEVLPGYVEKEGIGQLTIRKRF